MQSDKKEEFQALGLNSKPDRYETKVESPFYSTALRVSTVENLF